MAMAKRLNRSALEARRMEGGKLLMRGVPPAEVARRLDVSRTSVMRWERAIASGGRRSLRAARGELVGRRWSTRMDRNA